MGGALLVWQVLCPTPQQSGCQLRPAQRRATRDCHTASAGIPTNSSAVAARKTGCGRPACRHESRRPSPPIKMTAVKKRKSPVRCSMRGSSDQMTGADASQKALTKRYSLSVVASGKGAPGRAFGPASNPAKPERNGITASRPRIVCSLWRPPSPSRWFAYIILGSSRSALSIDPVKHYYGV